MTPPLLPVLVRGPRARAALRHSFARSRVRLVACRNPRQLERTLTTGLADGVVADPRIAGAQEMLRRLARSFPGVPRFAYSAFRPDDAGFLRECCSEGLAVPVVEGVEDPVLQDLVLPLTATARRVAILAAAPSLLRLRDDIQKRIWDEVLVRVGGKLRAADLARALHVSREHLSRQFAAGGAPNLKRVIDLARIATAADLLTNPGLSVRAVARVLGFASASHLVGAARRIAGVTASELARLGPAGVLAAFAKGRTRSRLG